MHKINVWHIGNLLGGPLGLEAAVYERVYAMDSGDKDGMREVFAMSLVPMYRRLPAHGQSMVKRSLQHFLNARSAEVVGRMIAESQDLPLSADDPFPALEALWEALFPAEDYTCTDLAEDVEENDDATGNEIFAPEGGWPK